LGPFLGIILLLYLMQGFEFVYCPFWPQPPLIQSLHASVFQSCFWKSCLSLAVHCQYYGPLSWLRFFLGCPPALFCTKQLVTRRVPKKGWSLRLGLPSPSSAICFLFFPLSVVLFLTLGNIELLSSKGTSPLSYLVLPSPQQNFISGELV